MANSPLELYENAYRLQYEKNDLASAIEIYSRLMQEFPDSNECGYAAIQLEKIQAAGILDEIGRAQKHTSHIPLIALILSILALVAVASLTALFITRSARDARISAGVTQALGLMYAGKNDEALKLISELQKQFPASQAAQSPAAETQPKEAGVPQPPIETAPSPPVQPETTIEETSAETAKTPAPKEDVTPSTLPKKKEPPVLSRQQKTLSHRLMAKPVRKAVPEQTPPPSPAAKTSTDDTISFFP